MSRAPCRFVLWTSMLLAATAAVAQPILLFSSDFTTDDTGYFGFEAFGQGVFAQMLWDESQGSPAPGSLRLELEEYGIGRALGPCLAFDQFSDYRISADVLAVSGDAPPPACRLVMRTYDEPGCTDEGASGGQTPGQFGVWVPVEMVLEAGDNPEAGIRFGMQIARFTGTGPSSCNIDNLEIVQEPLDCSGVPDLGTAARITFVLLLAGAGALLVSRFSR